MTNMLKHGCNNVKVRRNFKIQGSLGGIYRIIVGNNNFFINNFSTNAIHGSKLEKANVPANKIVELFTSIQNQLKHPRLANGDDLLLDFQELINIGINIPLDFLMKASAIFCKRFDPWRVEMLLHLASQSTKSPGDNRMNDGYAMLVEFAVQKLLLYNKHDYAFALWARVGESIGRGKSIERIIPAVPLSKRYTKLNFLSNLHATASLNLSNQSHYYYNNLAQSASQYFIGVTNTNAKVNTSITQKIIQDVSYLQQFLPSCLVSFRNSPLAGKEKNINLRNYQFTSRSLRLSLVSMLLSQAICIKQSDKFSSEHVAELLMKINHMLSDMYQIGDESHAFNSSNMGIQSQDLTHQISSIPPEVQVQTLVSKLMNLSMDKKSVQSKDIVVAPHNDSMWNDPDKLQIMSIFCRMTSISDSNEIATCFEKYIKFWNYHTIHPSYFCVNQAHPDAAAKCVTRSSPDSLQRWVSILAGRIVEAMHGSLLNSSFPMSQVLDKSTSFGKLMKDILQANGIHPTVNFYGSLLQTIFPSSVEESSIDTWNEQLNSVLKPTNGDLVFGEMTLDKFKDDPLFVHALVKVLCQSKSPKHVATAFTYINHLLSKKQRILPETWSTLIFATTAHLSDIDQSLILPKIESAIRLSGLATINHRSVLNSLLFANTRQAKAFKCIQLLQYIRANNIQPSTEMYARCLYAIYYFRPSDPSDWELVLNPTANCKWIIRDVLRDGKKVQPWFVAIMIKLFAKAAQISKSRSVNQAQDFIHQAEAFISELSQGIESYPKVQVTEAMVRELIQACCVGDLEDDAMRIVNEYPKKYSYKMTAKSFEPIFDMAAINRKPVGVLDNLLNHLKNNNIPLSRYIVDATILLLRQECLQSEAVTRIQSIFTSQGKKPSFGIIVMLLDDFLQASNRDEAVRLVSVIHQMYNETQRKEAFIDGPNVSVFEEVDDDANMELPFSCQESYESIDDNVDDNDLSLFPVISQEQSSQFDDIEREYYLNVEKANGYRRKSFMGPRDVGVFTDDYLRRRFRMFGLNYDD